jgi:hypothetical protein
MHPRQVEIYRAMLPADKLRIIEGMYWEARELKVAALRALRPDWSEERIQAEGRRIFTCAAS